MIKQRQEELGAQISQARHNTHLATVSALVELQAAAKELIDAVGALDGIVEIPNGEAMRLAKSADVVRVLIGEPSLQLKTQPAAIQGGQP